MAGETQFASLDAATLNGEPNERPSSSSNLARRSISIFSRRGTETPEPKPPFIAQAAMRTSPQPGEKKQKKWIRRKSCPSEANSKPRGTILNAVPPARTIKMTPLEEEMATSPNEEILTAIGSPTTQARFEWPAPDMRWSTSSIPQTQRTMSTRRKETNARIGVWRKGVTHWDEEGLREQNIVVEPSLKELTGFSPLRRFPTERLNNPRPEKPILSVVIPSSELFINDMTLSTIVKTESEPAVVSVAPINIMPRIAFTTATPPVEDFEDIASLIDSPSPLRSASAPTRPGAPIRANIERTAPPGFKRSRESSSSTISSMARPDEDTDGSQRSSATSVDVLADNSNVCEGYKPTSPTYSPDSPSVYSSFSKNVTLPALDLAKTSVPKSTPPPLPPRKAPTRPCSLIDSVNTLREQSRPNSMNLESEFRDALADSSCLAVPRFPVIDEVEDDSEAEQMATHSEEENEASGQEETTRAANELGSDLNDGAASNASEASRSGSIHRQSSVRSVLHPPERAPTIPRRSRKRDWLAARKTNRAVYLSMRTARRRKSESHLRPAFGETGEPQLLHRRASSVGMSVFHDVAELVQTPMASLLPPAPTIVIDDASECAVEEESDVASEETTSAGSAEDVLLRILASLDNPRDLLNTAVINKGMYRVFQENKADLMSTVLYNQSPPAWELREWSALDEADTPTLSMQRKSAAEQNMIAYRRDLRIIEALKKLILERCQTVIRRETAFALSTPTHPHAQRFNDAFWRIWCFCKIFGCGKGREEDITGQLDWLKGGLLAHNQNFSATANINLDFEMGSVLLNPPEYFAESNRGGLSARQLYDMTELWACMTTLLEGYHFRTEQAWDNGIFSECNVAHLDDQTEEELLEEWTSHLLTLGPKVVLEMAEYANDNSTAGFTLARIKGWTKWTPPAAEYNGSRAAFLKEPVSRLYEERVSATAAKMHNSTEEEKKEMSRKRVATLAAEIKLARQSSMYKRLPWIDMEMERPMSAFSRSNSVMSSGSMTSTRRQQQRNTVSNAPSPVYTPSPLPSSPYRRTSRRTLWSPRKISPIIEDRVETFNRMALENYAVGTCIPDDAVRHLVDMGFGGSQAREALRMTMMKEGEGMGGLRMDLAVDVLLSVRS